MSRSSLSAIGAFAIGVFLTAAIASCSSNAPQASNSPGTSPASNSAQKSTQAANIVRFGYQKSTILLKSKGLLEKRLAPEGAKVEWTEFPAGPPLLEALNVGAIDIGPVGESPPIFAQAAGAQLIYAASIAPNPKGSGILVPDNSPIQSVADLKGKKVAFAKGSSANYLIVQILEKGGLKFSDIQPIYLPPADARAAFVKGEVDAWVIWDPFYAAADEGANARVLVDGEGLNKTGGYYIASRKFAAENPKLLKSVLEEVRNLEDWSSQNRDEVTKVLTDALKLPVEAVKKATDRRQFGLKPVTDDLLVEQQKVADTYYQLKLIPNQISVRDAVLPPDQTAAFNFQ
ncbi:MAG: sulfonate ABC transporter substrate-binding protein [Phormidium tanganyikae FI6-MK23]|nr:sulfonate ABC transporter substrate-binding protein [Phormidium tanganyikae FI6-MK23]